MDPQDSLAVGGRDARLIFFNDTAAEAAQLAGGFHNNRAHFAAIADAQHSKGDLEPNGSVIIEAADL